MEVSGSTLWSITVVVRDVVAADCHSRVMRLRASTCLRHAGFLSLCAGRTTSEQVYITEDFGSSREKTPMGVTYVSGVRQKVLLQRAAHPHEPPLRPDPVGQVAHGDSASSSHSSHFCLSLKSLALPALCSPLLYLRGAVILPLTPTHPRVADTLAGTSHS